MNKKLIICLLLLVFAVGCALFIKGAAGKNFLLLEIGSYIEVDYAWEVDDVVIYEKNGETLFREKKEVRNIFQDEIKGSKDLMHRTYGHILIEGASVLFRFQTFIHGVSDGPVYRIVTGLALLACVSALFLLKRGRKSDDPVESANVLVRPDAVESAVRLAGLPEVEKYFLNLFRLQLGSSISDPARIVPDPERKSISGRVYTLSVKMNGEWKSRGMSIGPLGEDSGSRSQCFYVIFDTHVVVKIPSVPIRNFSAYIEQIRYEGRIVAKLAPRECIIPNVAVILSKIHHLPNAKNLTSAQIEKKYLIMLNSSSAYHDYLKIGGDFAFFMDLSRYYFLGHVMAGLHRIEEQITSVISVDTNSILGGHAFEDKYGSKNGWVCFGLQKLFGLFDSSLNNLIKQSGIFFAFDQQQKKDMFFSYLAWQDISLQQLGEGGKFHQEIKSLLQKIVSREAKTVQAYRNLAAEYAMSGLFTRNKSKIEGIIINLLVLLAWLGKNSVAIRDLKPDNLLVAGEPDNYPLFLSSYADYAIGLIDLETAVDYQPSENRSVEQPQLGGTPAYATPSHFFKNEFLEDLYSDLSIVLHMQDWYATLAIIYETVIGRRLFRKTSGRITELVQNVQQGIKENQDLQDIYKSENRKFWKSAVSEFKMALSRNERWLKSADVICPESMKTLFENNLQKEKGLINQRIIACLDSGSMSQEGKSREYLLHCSYEELCDDIEKYADSTKTTGEQSKPKCSEMEMLEDLAGFKAESERLSKLISQLERPQMALSAKDLLKLMFNQVFSSLCPESWEEFFGVDTRIEDIEESLPVDNNMKTIDLGGYTVTLDLNS